VNYDSGECWWLHNTITDAHRQRYAEILKGDTVTTPTHIGVGNKAKLSSEDASRFTKLKAEIARVAVTSKALQASDTARFVAIIPAGTATGKINEFGLFNAAEDALVVNNCDATTGWSTNTDGVLVLDPVTFNEGTGSIKTTITGDGTTMTSFQHTTLAINATSYTESTASLQFWYYVDNVDSIDGATMSVQAWTGDPDYYYWTITPSTELSTGWNWISLKFSDALQSGSPDITVDNITEFHMTTTKDNAVVVVERLDHVRIFGTNGDMWARVEPPSEINKTQGSVVGVYWFLAMKEGGATVAYTAYTKQTLTVSTSAIGFTTAYMQPTGGAEAARQVIVHIREGGPINYTIDGTTVTSTVGMGPYYEGSVLVIDGAGNIANFRAILDSKAVASATLECTYLR